MAAEGPNEDAAAVGGVAVAGDAAGVLEAVEDAGHGGGVRLRASGRGAGGRGHRRMAAEEIQAVQVEVLEVEAAADVVVEQSELGVQVCLGLLDRAVSAVVGARRVRVPCRIR